MHLCGSVFFIHNLDPILFNSGSGSGPEAKRFVIELQPDFQTFSETLGMFVKINDKLYTFRYRYKIIRLPNLHRFSVFNRIIKITIFRIRPVQKVSAPIGSGSARDRKLKKKITSSAGFTMNKKIYSNQIRRI